MVTGNSFLCLHTNYLPGKAQFNTSNGQFTTTPDAYS